MFLRKEVLVLKDAAQPGSHGSVSTGGEDTTEDSVSEWIKADTAIGMGCKLIAVQVVKDKDWDGIAKRHPIIGVRFWRGTLLGGRSRWDKRICRSSSGSR